MLARNNEARYTKCKTSTKEDNGRHKQQLEGTKEDTNHHGNARSITGDAGKFSVTLTLGIRTSPINRTRNVVSTGLNFNQKSRKNNKYVLTTYNLSDLQFEDDQKCFGA